jgi:hypothetical protein
MPPLLLHRARHRDGNPAAAAKRTHRLEVEILEDRRPISENIGTLLTIGALAGAAGALLDRASARARPTRSRRMALPTSIRRGPS